MIHHQNLKMLKNYFILQKLLNHQQYRNKETKELKVTRSIVKHSVSNWWYTQREWLKKICLSSVTKQCKFITVDLSNRSNVWNSETCGLCDFYDHEHFKEKDWYIGLVQCEENSQKNRSIALHWNDIPIKNTSTKQSMLSCALLQHKLKGNFKTVNRKQRLRK